MQTPTSTPSDYGWPASPKGEDRWEPRRAPTRMARRRGPTALDVLWVAFGLLGIAVAAAALTWYLGLRGAPSHPPVPNVIGLTQRAAVEELNRDGFVVKAVDVPSRTRPAGIVFAQLPGAGAHLRRGAIVTIRAARR